MSADGYKEKVTDEELINVIDQGVMNSTGDWLNSSDLARERLKATYEYAGLAVSHLAPQGVSTIVDTSTTEVIEAYTAVLSDLFLSNQRIGRFLPWDDTPGAFKGAKDAGALVNYTIFKQNNGWDILEQWMKSALLWKNSVIRWGYIEDFDYVFEEYDEISQTKLDELLSDDSNEIVGALEFQNKVTNPVGSILESPDIELVYVNVRCRKQINKSKIKLELVPPENFRISRDATTLDDATFVGIQSSLTRSEMRKLYPEMSESIDNWDELDGETWAGSLGYSQDVAARKEITGQEYTQGSNQYTGEMGLEALREVTITECWIHVDRDGDGIAELKHIISAGTTILHEEDATSIPLADIVPIDIPHEYYGLSMADFTRSSTLASTAILRGFVENTYLTNYAPKLADPNVVDFSALQNMKPKQIIPTNGNPAGAVFQMPPEAISTGTVPLLEHLQMIKEQATGMSKAAQGLNDTLYVSGNSEQKISAVQTASQKRIQHIARRFAETGFKRLISGLYDTLKTSMKGEVKFNFSGIFSTINMDTLPESMDVEILLDIGENSNSTKIAKLSKIGGEILPGLNQQGAGSVIKPVAPAVLATKLIEAMDIDSNDFLEDYTQPEFQQKAAQALQQQSEGAQADVENTKRLAIANTALAEANVNYTNAQAKNTVDDNSKQLAVAIDRHFQEWADLTIKATKEGATLPPHPEYSEILMMSRNLLQPNNEGENQ